MKVRFIALMMILLASAFVLSASETRNDSNVSTKNAVRKVIFPETKAVFYGSEIDLSRKWNICTGNTDGGVEVHLSETVHPLENCPGEYVMVRKYTFPDGKIITQRLRRLPVR